jgi:hypothetical protein
VAMPDRRNAPVFAAAAAFVLVLVFGKLIGSNSPAPNPHPSGSATPTSSFSPSPKTSSTGGHVATTPTTTATPATSSALTPLTVEVTEQASVASGVPVLDIPVQVLPEQRNATPVANGTLLPEGANVTSFQFTTRLASGTYQVCVQPPTGTKFLGRNTDALPGSFCTKVRLVPGSPPVMFTLAAG